eukprot:5896912-Alexandrium_andersonii.AAC.1
MKVVESGVGNVVPRNLRPQRRAAGWGRGAAARSKRCTLLQWLRQGAVSYTHLRAHETSAHL